MGGIPPKNAGRRDGWSVTGKAVYEGPHHPHVTVHYPTVQPCLGGAG